MRRARPPIGDRSGGQADGAGPFNGKSGIEIGSAAPSARRSGYGVVLLAVFEKPL